MKYQLRTHKLVSVDVRKAVKWYESQREGLGDEFDVELSESAQRITDAPLSHGFAFPEIRFNCLHRFPYVIYFVTVEAEVRVLAVLHGRQDNRRVNQRLKKWSS